jgi:hypothetical protein
MPVIRTHCALSRTGTLLVRELSRGTPFKDARLYAGVSWWEVLLRCLHGRRRFRSGSPAQKHRDSVFLLALAGARRRSRCDLGPILNWLVRPFEASAWNVQRA